MEEAEREEGVSTQTHSGSVSEEADCGGDGTVRNQALGTGLEGIGDRRRGGCRDPGSRRDLGNGDRCEFSGP